MVNERSLSSASASRPRTSRVENAFPAAGGGVCGSSREKSAERERGHRGDANRRGGGVDAELAEQQADGDPAERAKDADTAELGGRVLQVAHRDRVGQRQRRHVAERVGQHPDVHRVEGRERRDVPEEGGAEEVEDREDLLG